MSPRRRGLSIGTVLERLRGDFPDLTISKIRFLEAQGLVTPHRAASGYRQFSEADVDRLRYVLTAQRERFWPLKVIRDALDALDRGLTPNEDQVDARPSVPRPAADPDVPDPEALGAPATLRLTASELGEAAGLDSATLAALQGFGLLHAGPSGHYDSDALAVARAAAALAAYGVEARHLRSFRTAADREVGLVRQIVIPALAVRGRARTEADVDPTHDVLHQCVALHVALVRAELSR